VKRANGLFAALLRIAREDRPMSDSERDKLDEMTSRIKDVVASAESHLDAEGLLHRIRVAVGKVGSTIATDATMGRSKDVAGRAEGKIDADKLRHFVAEVDRDKLKGWLEEAQHFGAGAVSVVGTQGEKLADRAPGAFDKLAGAAKERLGSLTGDEGLLGEGQIERFKGQLKETISSVSEMTESRAKDAVEAVKTKFGDEMRRD
jgi:uncharacterized protein YjbJ (UPF0337 family)